MTISIIESFFRDQQVVKYSLVPFVIIIYLALLKNLNPYKNQFVNKLDQITHLILMINLTKGNIFTLTLTSCQMQYAKINNVINSTDHSNIDQTNQSVNLDFNLDQENQTQENQLKNYNFDLIKKSNKNVKQE
ncbi:hypothetical protein ABPG72_005727 [Tetrahymena utriculariae]